ncbi:MAG TPA: PDR/VanB family oxidoreductase [Burkholderiaceae bacterium]|nr:PDR/VanB family oxidoreductase [Burkholderiaceae bacterium]
MNAPSVLRVRVVRKTVEADDICSFELAGVDGTALPSFSAGSHVDVHIDVNGPGGLTRQYSLCSDPAESHRYLIGVLRDATSRGGSRAMHEQVHEGSELQISPPKNHFALAHHAPRHLLLAGGIGITPILCMAERLATVGADFELHYATRSRARTAFFERISGSRFAARVAFHFDDGDAGQRLDIAAVLARQSVLTHLYVCGPTGFMDAALAAARGGGWDEGRIHYEFFSADVRPRVGDGAFEVQLASSGRVIAVPADRSVLAALADAGVVVPSSCEQGVCGTCLTRVIGGTPDHRDQYLLPDEQAAGDQFLPCCSRAKSQRLVLDL